MSDTDSGGFAITPKRVTFWLAIAGLVGLALNASGNWFGQTYAIESLEKDQITLAKSVEELKSVVKELNGNVQTLTIAVARAEAAQSVK